MAMYKERPTRGGVLEDGPTSSAALKARLRQLLQANSDSSREAELLEMQEEERYIYALRQQREKIESLRREMTKKDATLAQLSEELQSKNKDRTETLRLSAALQQVQVQMADKDTELRELRTTLKRQVQEYEITIAELRQTLMKERNDRKNEAKQCDYKVEELHVAAQEQRMLAEKSAKYLQTAEQELSRAQSTEQERGRKHVEELKSCKLLEKTLKDQVAELAEEKYRIEGQLKDLLEHAEGQEARLDQFTDLEVLYHSEQQRTEELEAEVQRLVLLQESGQDGKSRAEQDCSAMKEELQRAAELIQRQERTISEMRVRRQEDQTSLSLLKDDLKSHSAETGQATGRWRAAQEELQHVKDALTDFEQTNQSLRRENAELLKQLQTLVEREEQERLERKQWAKVKMDLLSQREDEVSKLSEALETLPGDSRPTRASPYRRTMGAR